MSIDTPNTIKNVRNLVSIRKRNALLLCGLLLAICVAMSLIKIQGAVVATGVLTTETRNKRLQLLEGGRVSEILVTEGERVKQGQVLIRFDDTSEAKTLISVSQQIDFLSAVEARLSAEVSLYAKIESTPLVSARIPDNNYLKNELRRQQTILAARLESLSLEKARLAEGKKLRMADIKGLEEQLSASIAQQTIDKREKDRLGRLLKQGAVTEQLLDQAKKALAASIQRTGEIRSKIAQQKIAIAELEIQVAALERKFSEAALVELAKQRQRISELIEREAALEVRVKALTLSSPQDGTVHQLVVNSIGETVAPNAPIMEIVPSAEKLLIEAQIRTLDRDQVFKGQGASFQISAFDQQFLPQLNGTVDFVSADASQPDQTSEPVFISRITINAGELDKLNPLIPVPGMPVNVFISTQESSILAIVTKPFITFIERALRE